MVVTANFRRSSSEYQIDGNAVCIPLISSTGHGDAALHRLHYQEGRFALANLLVALLPKADDAYFPKYLYWYLTTHKDRILVPLMQGTANVSLKERDIAKVSIPLPPLEEQRRIVARVEALAARIEEARGLQSDLGKTVGAFCQTFFADKLENELQLVPMKELVTLRTPDVQVEASESYHFAGVYCFGRGVFRGGQKQGSEFAYPRLTRLRRGNFVYPKLMAWEGAFGVVPDNCDSLVVSTEFPVFEVNTERVLPETLDTYFKNPSTWSAVAGSSSGTNVRRRRLNPSDFLSYAMPLPSMRVQQKLARARQAFDEIAQLQTSTRLELDALLPAVLAKAFAGEL